MSKTEPRRVEFYDCALGAHGCNYLLVAKGDNAFSLLKERMKND